MFCRYCGYALPDDAAYCLRCGKSVAAAAPAPAPPPPASEAPAPVAREPQNPAAIRRASWIVAGIGVLGGLLLWTQVREQAQPAAAVAFPLIFAYALWGWYWGFYRAIRDREKFFFRPMRAASFGLRQKVGTNDPIGCIRIAALPFIAFIAIAVFDLLLALFIDGSFLYGVLGGGIYEYRRLSSLPK